METESHESNRLPEKASRPKNHAWNKYHSTSDRVVNGECPIGLIKATQLVELNDMGASLGVCPIGPYLDNSVAFYIPDHKGTAPSQCGQAVVSMVS